MPAAFAKISISVACDLRMGFSDRVDCNLSDFKKLINAPAGDRITACINDNRSFDIIKSADAAATISLASHKYLITSIIGARSWSLCKNYCRVVTVKLHPPIGFKHKGDRLAWLQQCPMDIVLF
jgi:hypothetical protein